MNFLTLFLPNKFLFPMKIFYPVNIFLTLVFCSVVSIVANAQSQPVPCVSKPDTILTGQGPIGLVEADFNGDGFTDIATANSGNSDVTVLLGNGQGSFTPLSGGPLSLQGNIPVAISSGDYDGNGTMDIAVAASLPFQSGGITYTNAALIFYSSVAGNTLTFSSPTNYSWESGVAQEMTGTMTSADFNGDGKSDIAIASYSDNQVYLLQSPYFDPATIPAASGTLPYGICSADFNKDNVPDLAVATFNYPGTVNVLLGSVTLEAETLKVASFSNVGVYSNVGDQLTSITTGDFNGDGYADLAAASNSYWQVYALLNTQSNGSFNAPYLVNFGAGYPTVSSADYNGDGYADLATANGGYVGYYYYNSMSVMLSTGQSGNFGSPVTFTTGTNTVGLVSGYFNADALIDIAVANENDNDVEVFINRFHNQAVTINNLSKTYCQKAPPVALTGSPAGGTFSGTGIVYEGITDSLFSPLVASQGESGSFNATAPVSYTYTDANGCVYTGYDTATILQAPNFSTYNGLATSYFINTPNDTITIYPPGGKFAGAGISDTFSVATIPGYTAAVFSPAQAGPGGHELIYSYKDTNNCIDLDTITVTVVKTGNVSTSVQASTQPLCFSIPGNYPPPTNYGNPYIYSIATGDFNADGQQEIAAADEDNNAVYVYINQGRGAFGSSVAFTNGSESSYTINYVASGYFDADTLLDFATANTLSNYDGQYDGQVSVFINSTSPGGSPSFTDNGDFSVGYNPVAIISADFNNDGLADIVTANQSAAYFEGGRVEEGYNPTGPVISVLLNSSASAGTFTESDYFIPSASNPIALATGDFNKDGYKDIATVDNGSNTVAIMYNDNTGGFGSSDTVYKVGQNLQAITSGDFNGDGLADLAVADYGVINQAPLRIAALSGGGGSGTIYIFLGSGAGKTTTFTVSGFAANASPNNIRNADFNGDGKLDLITANDDGSTSVFTGDGTGLFAKAGSSIIGSELYALATADFNGDKKLDFVTSDVDNKVIAIEVLLNDFEKVSIPGLGTTYCHSSDSVLLFGNPTGGQFQPETTATGKWIVKPLGGDTVIFYPQNAIISSDSAYTNNINFTYTYTSVTGCNFTYTTKTKVYKSDSVSFAGLSSSYCINNSSTATLTGYPTGGIFSVVPQPPAGTISNGSIFTPSIAGLGQHNFVYSYTNPATGCVTTSTKTTDVYNSSTVYFSGLDSVYCTNTKSVTLTGFPAGGTFSGSGVTGNTFSPSSVNAGVYTITYSVTSSNGCGGSYNSSTVVNNAITVSVSGLSSILCTNSPNILLTPSSSSSGGKFSAPDAPNAIIEGTNGTTFSPSIAGVGKNTIYYTYTNSLGCSGIDTLVTQIYAPTPVSFSGLANSYCANANSVNLKGSPSGPHGYFSTVGGDTSAFTNSAFYPSRTGITTKDSNYSVIYTFIDTNNCSNSYTVSTSIIGLPITTISGVEKEYCALDPTTYTVVGHPRGGTLTSLIGSYNALTTDSGTFTPTLANPQDLSESGTMLYTYTDAVTGCSNTDIDSISIYRVPVVSSLKPVCYSAAPLPLVAVAHPNVGTFTYTGTGITGNLFDPSKIKTGVDTVTYQYTTAIGGCKTSGSIVLQLYKPNVQLLAINQSTGQRSALANAYCFNAGNIVISADLSPGTYLYSNSNAFLIANDSTMIFNPSAAGTTNTFTYIYTDTNSCSDTVTQTITVKPSPKKPVISALDTISICQNLTLNLTATDSSSGVTYAWNTPQKAYTQQTVSIDSIQTEGKGTYSVTVTSSNNCTNSDSVYVLVKPSPVIANFYTPVTAACDFNTVPVLIAVESDIHNYNWYYNDIKISGQHSNTLAIASAGDYKVAIVNSANNCITYDSVTISGNGQTPVISLSLIHI